MTLDLSEFDFNDRRVIVAALRRAARQAEAKREKWLGEPIKAYALDRFADKLDEVR